MSNAPEYKIKIKTKTKEEQDATIAALIELGYYYNNGNIWTFERANTYFSEWPHLLIAGRSFYGAKTYNNDGSEISLEDFLKRQHTEFSILKNFRGPSQATIDHKEKKIFIGCQKFEFDRILDLANEIERRKNAK